MIHIVVPMTADGRQFQDRGYSLPQPLVQVAGQPLIEVVVRNLTPLGEHQFIFVCRQEHMAGGALGPVLQSIAPGCRVLPLRHPTPGAICSLMLGLEQLQGDDELLIGHADQWIDESIDRFLAAARAAAMDGCLMTFPCSDAGWPYVRTERGRVTTVAEREPISRQAATGLYYFRRSAEFLEAVERMLQKNSSVTDRFYVAPVFGELILSGAKIGTFDIHGSQMHGLSTPEDVERFQARLFAHVA